jgi:hypothetical protein
VIDGADLNSVQALNHKRLVAKKMTFLFLLIESFIGTFVFDTVLPGQGYFQASNGTFKALMTLSFVAPAEFMNVRHYLTN